MIRSVSIAIDFDQVVHEVLINLKNCKKVIRSSGNAGIIIELAFEL